MVTPKRILFPTDFSRCADQAWLHAVHWAKHHGAELHAFHAVVLHDYDPHNPDYQFPAISEEIGEQLQTAVADNLNNALAGLEGGGLIVKQAQVRAVAAAPVILDYVNANDIDFVVMGTNGRRGLGHFFLGSVAEEVVRYAPCPVLTVREQKDAVPPEAVERVLVPLDFSAPSQKALASAKHIAASYGARLDLLHIIEETIHPAFYSVGKTSILELASDLVDKSRQEMSRLLAEIDGPDVPAELYVQEGRATRDITRFAADHQSDLIVIATHGLTGIEHLLLGSATEKVVRFAPCPVFTVKSPDAAAPGS